MVSPERCGRGCADILQTRRHLVVLKAVLCRQCVGGAGCRIYPRPPIVAEEGRRGREVEGVGDWLRRARSSSATDAMPCLLRGNPVPIALPELRFVGVRHPLPPGPGLQRSNVPHRHNVLAQKTVKIFIRPSDLRAIETGFRVVSQ